MAYSDWELLWKGRARVYFNSAANYPHIWSVDDGNIAHEVICSNIELMLGGFKTVARTEDMPSQPKVWLAHNNCAVYKSTKTNVVQIVLR